MSNEQEDRKGVGDDVREGIRAGLGVLSALKDAIEETFEEMMDRGELSQDRAREAAKTTMDRAQEAFEEARSRFDFVLRSEFDDLAEDVRELRRRVERLENQAHDHATTDEGEDATPDSPAL